MTEFLERFLARWTEARSAVVGFADSHGLLTVLAAVLLATLVGLLLLRVLRSILRRFEWRIASWRGSRIRAIRLQDQEILSEEQATQTAVISTRWAGYLILALVFYAYLQIVLSFFATTRGLASKLFGFLVDALAAGLMAFVNYLPSLGILLLIFLLASYAVKAARLVFNGIREGSVTFPGFYREWASPTFSIVRVLIIVFAVIIAFPYLPGHDSPAFRAVSVFLGVLLSLGSTGAVANAISGIVLTYMRAFDVGDRVKLADATGDVIEKTTFVTRLRTVKNVEITIPNAMVMSNHMINYSAPAKRDGVLLHTAVTIGYDVPWRKVHTLLAEAALATADVEREPRPFVLQTALEDYYVRYELNLATRKAERMAGIYGELHQNIQDRFNEAGIEIASPAITALRDGNRAQIPEDYLPRDYEPGGFRFWPPGGRRGGDGEGEQGR